jgi:DNA-binding response OmpR family regulator
LRSKLGESASAPRYLHTVRGVGIKLLAPDD